MKVRWGLQAKMTMSYVVITALAVLAVEAVVIGVVAPKVLSLQDLQTRVQATASGLAGKLTAGSAQGDSATTELGRPDKALTPGVAQPDSAGGVYIPWDPKPMCDPGPASFAIVVSYSGNVLATSYPACFGVGNPAGLLPGAPAVTFARPASGMGTSSLASGKVLWATEPVGSVGTLYVQVPAVARSSRINPSLLRAGLWLLLLTVPIGFVFGVVNTRPLTRRVSRLAFSTLDVADGAFDRRIDVTGHDELSQLEQNFNRMAEQLQDSMAAERQLAGANARHGERSRIARELHDSISQDLFSLSVLAGGLRKALPSDSALMPEVETMEHTAAATMREMQALLLELRPVALDEVGLVAALEQLCDAYRDRLGIQVEADLQAPVLPSALEHAVLRVAQESLANAVKHADAKLIRLDLHADNGYVVLQVTDDGRGFDPSVESGAAGLGLQAMKDRVSELAGSLSVETTKDQGTIVRATLPWTQT